MLKNIIFISILIFIIGCNKEILNTDNVDFNEETYISGNMSTDSIYIVLTRSIPRKYLFTNYSTLINDTSAIVEVFENNNFFCRLKYKYDTQRGDSTKHVYYYSDAKPMPGKTYQLKIQYIGKEMTANVHIPNIVEIQKVDTLTYIEKRTGVIWDSLGGYSDTESELEILVRKYNCNYTDPLDANNYYLIKENEFLGYGFINDPLSEKDFLGIRDRGQIPVFSDKIINGKNYQFNYTYPNYKEDTVHLKLLSLNEDLYKYIVSSNLFYETYRDSYREPIMPYFNVKNGLGIIGGYSYSEVVIYPSGKFEVLK